MDSSASYSYRELIQTYIQTQRNNHIHPDFKNYYSGLLTQLEQLFEVDFASPPSSGRALWMLFRATIASYLSLKAPWSGFLEGGLIVQKIRDLGSQGLMTCAIRSWPSSLTTITRWQNPSSGPTLVLHDHGEISASMY